MKAEQLYNTIKARQPGLLLPLANWKGTLENWYEGLYGKNKDIWQEIEESLDCGQELVKVMRQVRDFMNNGDWAAVGQPDAPPKSFKTGYGAGGDLGIWQDAHTMFSVLSGTPEILTKLGSWNGSVYDFIKSLEGDECEAWDKAEEAIDAGNHSGFSFSVVIKLLGYRCRNERWPQEEDCK